MLSRACTSAQSCQGHKCSHTRNVDEGACLKLGNTATIACFQIRKKMIEKASRLPSVYIYICNLAFFLPNSARYFFVCKQLRRRSASAPAQFYQLSLESMIAKPASCKNKNKIPVRHACADPDNSNEVGGGGGGGSNCFSREVRTSFHFFIFKLCILLVHTLIFTSYFVHI